MQSIETNEGQQPSESDEQPEQAVFLDVQVHFKPEDTEGREGKVLYTYLGTRKWDTFKFAFGNDIFKVEININDKTVLLSIERSSNSVLLEELKRACAQFEGDLKRGAGAFSTQETGRVHPNKRRRRV